MNALDGLTPQRNDVVVCQVCGRSTFPKTKHWLDQPHKDILGLRVQRCPQHWTDWALRNTREGRTNANRAAMKEALQQDAPAIHPYAEPWSAVPLPDNADDIKPLDMMRDASAPIGDQLNRRKRVQELLKKRARDEELPTDPHR